MRSNTTPGANGDRGNTAFSLATPPGRPAGLAGLLTFRRPAYFAALGGIALGRWWGAPLRLGSTVIVTRHEDVVEALARDLEFVIQPVNAPKFDLIGFHFILGMDRSAELIAERQSLYAALARSDTPALRRAAQDHVTKLLSVCGNAVDVVEGYARPVASATASRLFGIAPSDNAEFMDVARAIFGNCFLNIGGDQAMARRAMAGAKLLSDWFEAEMARRRANGNPGDDMMGALMAAGSSDDLTRRTLGGMLVGAIDTTASCVAKIMAVLMADRRLLRSAQADRANPIRTWGWCNEALRRWAHGPALLRNAAKDTRLAGTAIRAGDSVVLWTQAAMLDPSAFPRPRELLPDRVDAPYIHLGGGLHPCAGRGINAWQIPLLVSALLERKPARLQSMQWAGPFPAHLLLEFEA